MSVKDWYRLLVDTNVTRRDIDEEGRSELVPCKVVQKYTDVPWNESYRLSRLIGISPDDKSFLFKLVHILLPSKERVLHLSPNTSPLCLCGSGDQETYKHLFFQCQLNSEAGEALFRCVKSYNQSLTLEKMLRLELVSDDPFLLASVSLLATGLSLIWQNRKVSKNTTLYMMHVELELAVSVRRRS